jgi:hypothetical protein
VKAGYSASLHTPVTNESEHSRLSAHAQGPVAVGERYSATRTREASCTGVESTGTEAILEPTQEQQITIILCMTSRRNDSVLDQTLNVT